MVKNQKLPIGIDSFEKIRANHFYYIDKTGLIASIIQNWGEVNLFTRPRRFGKSLNMSMLKCFFETGCDKSLFDGLKVSEDKELCEKYMGKFPVISITLKGVEGLNFEAACSAMRNLIGTEALRFQFLSDSDRLSDREKEMYDQLVHVGTERNAIFDMSDSLLAESLRISKESIFTGLNNINVMSITDEYFDEYFGFTDADVHELLACYDLESAYPTIKEWYDGYQFGNTSIYCPWDVVKYCQALLKNRQAIPENYWANTSGNAMVRRFIDKANQQTRNEIERLISGESISKSINMELTYNELDSSIDNLWSVLLTTGYLTQHGRSEGKSYQLSIPNREIRDLFISQIREWFRDTTRADVPRMDCH